MLDEVLNQEARKAPERESMNAGAKALLNGADGAFDFAHVAVRGHNVSDNGEKVLADAVEFVIPMQGRNGETTTSVGFEDGSEGVENGVAVAVRHERGGAITNVSGDGVEKWDALYVEKIGAKGHMKVVFQYRGRERNSFEIRDVRGGYSLGCGAFEKRHVFAVDREGACRVCRSNRAVMQEVVAQNALESVFGGAA
jgi:hypothetical protein